MLAGVFPAVRVSFADPFSVSRYPEGEFIMRTNRRSNCASRPWRIGLVLAITVIALEAHAQQPKPRAMVGAYYFDGWSGKTSHVTELLQTKYADRKPLWGWKADTVEIIQKQIDYCADHGIAFWAIDWYYPEGENKIRRSTTPSDCT